MAGGSRRAFERREDVPRAPAPGHAARSRRLDVRPPHAADRGSDGASADPDRRPERSGSVAERLGTRRRLLRGLRAQLPDSDGDGKGDLSGLIAKLDYLNDGDPATTTDLGVDALWLMPVFASPSYHGYDTTDYETINPDYGTNADFARLLAEAHRRGIRVIVDFVVNHTGSGHPWFADSASSPVLGRSATGTSGAPTIRAGRSPGAARTRRGTRGTAPTTTASSGAACPT